MKPEELKKKVDSIIEIRGDAEVAHSDEDELHMEVIREFCPEWVKAEIERLYREDFPRWCA